MPLTPGTRIGQYEITGVLGAGGMGEVYRARDTKLDRDVAIKVLPESFLTDQDRLSRFEREAKTLAALNHQNIAHVYDAGRLRLEGTGSPGGDVAFLVMELVEGEDLSAHIERGPMRTVEALSIVRQLVEALETAHDAGIVHRDLKPANIKIRSDGTVKVLDFGLAKISEAAGAADRKDGASATMTSPAVTGLGVILGTASYMSPEQARGRVVDKRADIWAFGTVWFEMLTGRAPFPGETITDVIAAVVTKEPDWTSLPPDTSPLTRTLLARCLEKDPKQRLRDIGEVRLALAGNAPAASMPAGPTPARSRTASLGWILAALLLLALAVSVWPRREAQSSAMASVIKYDVAPPGKAAIRLDSRPAVDISPDGSTIVFMATDDGITRLYLKRRDEAEIRVLPGTDGGMNPVFSPDGKSVAYVTRTELMRMRLDGAPVVITKIADSRGITWLDNENIVFSGDSVAGISMVPASGGTVKTLTTVDPKAGDRTHRWPAVVPGGKAVLFTVGTSSSPDNYDESRIDAVIVATGERRNVMEGSSFVRIGPGGMLFYAKAGTVYAVPFDSEGLKPAGTPVAVLQGVATDTTTGAAHASFGPEGTLAYVPGSTSTIDRQLFWVDRKGAATAIPLAPGLYNDIRISPDGSRIAVLVGASGSGDVYIYDTHSTAFERFTLDQVNGTPIWSRDGKSLYYVALSSAGDSTTLLKRPIDRSAEAAKLGSLGARAYLDAIDPSETIAYANRYDLQTRAQVDIVSVPIGSDKETVLDGGKANQYASALSADGRWLAYQSDETGRAEIWVMDLKTSGARRQVSTAGGEEPHWSKDGKEIFYRDDTRLMSVAVTTTPEFRSNPPTVLFDSVYNLRSDSGVTYDVDPVTGRFVMLRPAGQGTGAVVARVRVVVNWLEELQRQLRAK